MNFLTTVLILSLPHILYAFVWTQSKTFMKFVSIYVGKKADPVNVFAKLAYGIKLLQFAAFLAFYLNLGYPKLADISPLQTLLGLILGGIGQILNGAIYKAIGVDGVYYGTRLGKKVPWVDGFPFNVVAHPQYVGSALSIWGAVLVLYTAPQHQPLIPMAAIWSGFYAVSGLIEQKL